MRLDGWGSIEDRIEYRFLSGDLFEEGSLAIRRHVDSECIYYPWWAMKDRAAFFWRGAAARAWEEARRRWRSSRWDSPRRTSPFFGVCGAAARPSGSGVPSPPSPQPSPPTSPERCCNPRSVRTLSRSSSCTNCSPPSPESKACKNPCPPSQPVYCYSPKRSRSSNLHGTLPCYGYIILPILSVPPCTLSHISPSSSSLPIIPISYIVNSIASIP